MSTIDIKDIPGTNCYLDDSAVSAVSALMGELPLKDIHFIGSGNYHYLSYMFLGRVTSPFYLVLFDNHPDCQEPAFGDILSCGGWVRKAISDYPMLLRVFIVGASAEHISEEEPFPEKVTIVSDIAAITEGFSGVFSEDFSVEASGEVSREASGGPGEVSGEISSVKGVEVPGIYISIDKDVLSEEFAVTDWDQGNMTLEEMCKTLKSIGELAEKSGSSIIGIDICGDSKSEPNGPDHPINSYSNSRLIEVLSPFISC